MNRLGQAWKRLPAQVRKTIVLIVGMTFVIAAPFTGVLPGPGGIPIFLIGVAILATEFQWAERFKVRLLRLLDGMRQWYNHNRAFANIIIAFGVMCTGLALFLYYAYNQ